ncbi:Putative zinc- or iron-chelating domain protein [uncultured archaeon]|nr:Putative zinc- or iron-chelating domain protein [uncultured archaeon]
MPDMNNDSEQITRVRRICHQLCYSSCVDEKRKGLHERLLCLRPHWSVSKKEEQFQMIDQGADVPFDISLPLPARDGRPDSDRGVKLFWERFRCQQCGGCCFTPGAGLFLEMEDFERIAERIGKKKLKAMCKFDRLLKAWTLVQPCPFYDMEKRRCQIYDIRPATCAKYPLHPPAKQLPYNLAVDAFCPAARQFAKDTLGWWVICENNWAGILRKLERD